MRLQFALAVVLVCSACGKRTAELSTLSEEYVFTVLSFSPVAATAVGYHNHIGVDLDSALDDMSASSIYRQKSFNDRFRSRLGREVDAGSLSPEDRADYDIIQDQIALAGLEIDRIQNWKHNPTLYVELVGNALFQPYVLEYAPKPQRYRHIISRLEKVPLLMDQAKANLVSAPGIWTKVAMEENDGNIALIEKTLRAEVPSELRETYDAAAKTALSALHGFQVFLGKDLAARDNRDWRLGRSRYTAKFRYVLATDLSPEQVLANAERDLQRVRGRMLELALPLHRTWFRDHGDHSGGPVPERENAIIGEVLDRIAEKHSTPETYIPDARRDLEEARNFVKQAGFLTLPPRDNLQVIETPEFMRGIYAVGGFASAPALEPHLGAFYWITPIPPDWPAQRVESKLREYNYYKLKLLTIHEAMPGHYVQLEYANDVQPRTRRVLRSVFGNGPYIEGWAQYATEMMLDAGYLNHSPELRLTFLKEELRVLANAILDIRLHMLDMTDAEAMDLMKRQTFQEHEEAAAKLQRAKLSSAQLPTYLVGWRDWVRVREHYRQVKQGEFSLRDFNDSALKAGAVPLPVLSRLLTGSSPNGDAR